MSEPGVWAPPPRPAASPRRARFRWLLVGVAVVCLSVAALAWAAVRVSSLPGYAFGGFGALETRFEASRAEFDDIVRTLSTPEQQAQCADAGPDGWVDVDVPSRIGDYRIMYASCVPGGFVFYEASGSLFDDAGFAYLPSGPHPGLDTGWFEAPEFHSLGGGWYSFTASW